MDQQINPFSHQQIGLFTFYKEQQQQPSHHTILNQSKKKNSTKTKKIKVKHIKSSKQHKQSHQPKSTQVNTKPNYQNFVKSDLAIATNQHNCLQHNQSHPRYQRIYTQPNTKIFKQTHQNITKSINKLHHNYHQINYNHYNLSHQTQNNQQKNSSNTIQAYHNNSIEINQKVEQTEQYKYLKQIKKPELERQFKLPVLNFTQKMLENKKIYHKRQSSILYEKLSIYFNQKGINKNKFQIIQHKRQKTISACLKKVNHGSVKNIIRQNRSNQKKKKNQKAQQPTFFNLSHKIIQQDKIDWEERKKAFLKKLGIRI